MFLSNIAQVITVILYVFFLVILLLGVAVSWMKSFKEGAIFFVLVLLYISALYFLQDQFAHYPNYSELGLQILVTLAACILVIGLYRRLKN